MREKNAALARSQFGTSQNQPNLACSPTTFRPAFVALAYQGKNIVYRFIMKNSGLRDFGPY